MTHTVSSTSGSGNRPRLCRSDHQPNMLEYIDTTLNDSFSSRLKLQTTTTTTTTNSTTIPNGYDQFGNTIVDQYLLYILCQKLSPNRTDNRTEQLYHSLHQLFLSNGKISKSFFEYSPPLPNRSNYQSLFNNYTSFIWNEFDVDILLELACFLLKYRLRDIFLPMTNNKTNINVRQKILGYFVEILAIYYLSTNHHEFFLNSRSKDMLFPYPSSILSSDDNSQADQDTSTFSKFLRKLYDNGEIRFDMRQIKVLLQSDAYQFLNKKLENKKIGLINFFEPILRYQQERSCRSLKSTCRLAIKMQIKQFPNDIKHLALYPSMNDRLLTYLTYENKYAFESYV